MSPQSIVIVGNGVAGTTAARTIKQQNPQTKVSVYTDETYQYYPRPRLYEVLSGETQPQRICVFSEEYYKTKGIDVFLNKKVAYIDTKQQELTLDDQTKAAYDKLLLANGAYSFVPPINGSQKEGVFTLRSINDALTIKDYTKNCKEAIVIGGGLLGLEFAYSLIRLGQKVTVVEMFPRLLPRQLDHNGATILKNKIESLGINIVLGVKTQEILGKQKAMGILLDNNQTISGELILVSAGVRPNTELATKSGIKVNKGIIVDSYMKTSADHVYAAGDSTEFEGAVYGIIPAAIEQATIAANNMTTTQQTAYNGTTPTNTLKIVNIDLTSTGTVNPENQNITEIKKTDPTKGIYKKLVIDNGTIIGTIILGTTKGVTTINQLMTQKTDITKYKNTILNDDFDYKKITTLT
ncbi:MAG: FAD-dependent oxidoreductase [Candidatus Bathyarchaeia archaeon]|jgi:nitrite reductase (NADH) large subunit